MKTLKCSSGHAECSFKKHAKKFFAKKNIFFHTEIFLQNVALDTQNAALKTLSKNFRQNSEIFPLKVRE